MAIKGTALTVTFTVWDTSSNVPLTGDAANLTMRVIKDGTAAAATNAAAEKENGEYSLLLTAAEMNANFVTVEGSSSTENAVVFPLHIATHPAYAEAGAAMALTSAERTTLAGVIWTYTTRTLSSITALLSTIATYLWSTHTSRTLTAATSAASISTAGCTVTIAIDQTPYDQVAGKIKLDQHTAPKITLTVYDDGSVRDVSGYTFTFAGYDADGDELFSIADASFNKDDAASGIVWFRPTAANLATAVAAGRFELKMTDTDENERPVKGALEIVTSHLE